MPRGQHPASRAALAAHTSTILPLWDRLWSQVDMSAGLTGCWPWTGGKSIKRHGKDRGIIREGGRGSRVLLVHRVALCFAGEGLREYDRAEQAGHRCGNRLCCNNYSHLYWATREENSMDRTEHENGARLIVRVDIAEELRAMLAEIEAEYQTGIAHVARQVDDSEGSVRLRRMMALQSAILSVQAANDREVPF